MLGLRGQDGREIYKALKQDDGLKDIPIILFSAMLGVKENLSMYYDASDFIARPFDVHHLVKTVKRHLKAA